jgi:glycosyltransferase 2 family protein
MTQPQPELPPAGPERPPAAAGPGATGAVHVTDHLEARIRLPADLLRCVIASVEIVLLAGLGLLARATATGVEYDVGHASRRVPALLLGVMGFLAHFALLVLPAALAARLIVRRQPRRLAEAVLTALIAAAVVAGANLLLLHAAATQVYQALAPSGAGRHAVPLDGYLAGLAAYVTVIGLSGSQRWRTAFWLTIAFYALASLANDHANILSLLIALLIGSAIGSGLRYAFGSASERPSAAAIAAALGAAGCPLAEIRRVWDESPETRRYAAVTTPGDRLDITVFDRDQQAADVLYRLYRRIRLKAQVSRIVPFTVQRAVEHRALLTYAAEEAGVPTPALRALVRAGPEAVVLANEHHRGVTLAQRNSSLTDAEINRVWDTVLRLHAHRVTHRALTGDRILLLAEGRAGDEQPGDGQKGERQAGERQAGDGRPGDGRPGDGDGGVMLLEPGNGDVAASDLQLRLDISQLLAELALLVGPDRAADIARQRIGADELAAVVPLLQPVALHRSTRAVLRRRKDVLPALRKRLVAPVADRDVAPAQLERIRPRTLISLVATVVAVYLLVGQLDRVKLGGLLHHANWRWTAAALALSAVSYFGAAWSLTGFVLERLSLLRTLLAQLAASFVTLVTPAAVGGVALNLRYLRRANVAPADAAASVGVSQLIAFALHAILLVAFAALARTAHAHSLRPPGWVYIAIGALVAAALIALAFPGGRRLLRSRLAPALEQVIPRLLDIAQQPVKLAEGIGGALLVTVSYILCLQTSVLALGGSVQFVAVAIVYLTGSAIGSAVPTPGGLGAVEAALSAGLTAAGMPAITAVSAVLLYRTVTFWLPVPLGWAALTYLQRHEAL